MTGIPPGRAISVVVPAWNRAALLPETLDRILAQTRPAEEVIVVDDGSEDDTPAVLARYAARGVRTIRTTNAGDLAARNVGTAAARGPLVAFCDSDDLWHPGFLAAMEEMWRRAPRLVAAYGDFREMRDGVRDARTKFEGAPPGFWNGLTALGAEGMFAFDRPVVERLVRYQPFFPSALVADRAFLLSAGGWDECANGLVGRDFATALRIAEHAPLGILRRPLVDVRKHGTNDSRDVLAMNLGDAEVLDRVIRARPSLAPHARAFGDSAAARRRAALDTAFARGDFEAVRRIATMLPAGALPRLSRIKHAVAGLPPPVRIPLARVLKIVGTVRGWTRRVAPGVRSAPA